MPSEPEQPSWPTGNAASERPRAGATWRAWWGHDAAWARRVVANPGPENRPVSREIQVDAAQPVEPAAFGKLEQTDLMRWAVTASAAQAAQVERAAAPAGPGGPAPPAVQGVPAAAGAQREPEEASHPGGQQGVEVSGEIREPPSDNPLQEMKRPAAEPAGVADSWSPEAVAVVAGASGAARCTAAGEQPAAAGAPDIPDSAEPAEFLPARADRAGPRPAEHHHGQAFGPDNPWEFHRSRASEDTAMLAVGASIAAAQRVAGTRIPVRQGVAGVEEACTVSGASAGRPAAVDSRSPGAPAVVGAADTGAAPGRRTAAAEARRPGEPVERAPPPGFRTGDNCKAGSDAGHGTRIACSGRCSSHRTSTAALV